MRFIRELTCMACGAMALCSIIIAPAQAQNPSMEEIQGKIFDAHMAEKTFADGLKFCSELNGKSFYQRLHNRLLNLEEYFHSLDNLVKAQVFNPEKRRPWTVEDAKERWEEVKKQAEDDRQKCELVQKLPELEKQLQELQKNAVASDKKE